MESRRRHSSIHEFKVMDQRTKNRPRRKKSSNDEDEKEDYKNKKGRKKKQDPRNEKRDLNKRYSPSTKEELCEKRKELVKQRRTPDAETKEKKDTKIHRASTSKHSSLNKTSSTKTTKDSSAREQKESPNTTTPSRPPPRLSDGKSPRRAFLEDSSTKDHKKAPTDKQKTVQKPHSSLPVSKSTKRKIDIDIFSSDCKSESSNSKIPKKDIAADTSAKNAPSKHKSSTSDPLPSKLEQTKVQPNKKPAFINSFSPVLNTEPSSVKIPKKSIVAVIDRTAKDNKTAPTNGGNKPSSSKLSPLDFKPRTVQRTQDLRPQLVNKLSPACRNELSNFKIPKKAILADTSVKDTKTAPASSGPSSSKFKTPQKANTTTKDPKTYGTNSGSKPSKIVGLSSNFPVQQSPSSCTFSSSLEIQKQNPTEHAFPLSDSYTKSSNLSISKKAIATDTSVKDRKTAANGGHSSSNFEASQPVVKQNTAQTNHKLQTSSVDTFSPQSSKFKTPQKANTTTKDTKSYGSNSGSKPSNTGTLSSNFPVQQSPSSCTFSSGLEMQKQNPGITFEDAFLPYCYTNSSNFSICKTSIAADTLPKDQIIGPPSIDQTKVVEELNLARSERRLELMQSYGELTCMEIDPPEEGVRNEQSKELPQHKLVLVLDTNILLSHLVYVKNVVCRGLGGVGSLVVLVPWVVLQELDSLKKGRQTGCVAHKAIPAISFIYDSLKNKESRLWGQSMQQAAESENGLNAQNNDDRVLQCCLQYQQLYPEGAVVLCTDDKNLCSKALLSGVTAFSKRDLEEEVVRSHQSIPFFQNIHRPAPSTTRHALTLNKSCAASEIQGQETTGLCVDGENSHLRKVDDAKRCWDHSSLLCEFESCLQGALSDVLEAEMKAGFEDMWLEIVFIKPPWSLHDVLQCFKKHWYAVFGLLVPRNLEQNVLNLIEYFKSGKTPDYSSTLTALQESKDLLKELVKSSSRVPAAISVLNDILNKLQTQGETAACDVVMKEEEEDKQPTSPQLSHSNVWAIFENIWDTMFQTSLKVFKALDFDPNAPPSVRSVGGPPPSRDAMACLDQLLCVASQLLQAFSSVLSSAPGLGEVQSLFSVVQSSKIVNVDKLTTADLLDCFSQQKYRECLNNGGKQLLELKAGLERCVEFTGHSVPFPARL